MARRIPEARRPVGAQRLLDMAGEERSGEGIYGHADELVRGLTYTMAAGRLGAAPVDDQGGYGTSIFMAVLSIMH